MKLKLFVFLTLGAFLVTLIACSDEMDSSLLDDDGPRVVSDRSSNALSISYEITTDQMIEPTNGTIEELCAIDIKMIAVPSSTTTVSTTFNPDGEACIIMEQKTQERGQKGGKASKGGKANTTSYCNGVLTHTSEDGSTTTYETDIDIKFFKTIYENYYYTETQKDSVMNVLIEDAKNSGAKTTINGDVLTIIEIDTEGNTTTTVYDMKNHVMITSQTTDPSGKILNKTVLNYTCKPDGTLVPKFIVNYNYKDDLICSDPVYTIEQSTFNNYQISL